ncbi:MULTISPECIES: hypothetical protein [unclassified Streptomyces]|uniref:hypothetical protein n=1 Tax=unclassified Streptomyces TaxID=2593676 RepID=UPI001906EBC5|nr:MULTISPECIES: hypothetical protein [unclassified Streptomyces]MCU4749343.1 hypothetical protein [Streptomyces sp. G-5]QQN77123.1 hypothetical protein IPZ77_06440 [Streptomyces sp. XC 2026]
MNRVDIDWRSVLHGGPLTDRPGLHWHGFFWTGNGNDLYSYKRQPERTAGTPDFPASALPPETTAHYLLKSRLLKGTWTTVGAAADWMRQQWDTHTPAVTHEDPDNRRRYSEITLSHGEDDVWRWWHPAPPGPGMVHVAVVCCPHKSAAGRAIPCPQPPAAHSNT